MSQEGPLKYVEEHRSRRGSEPLQAFLDAIPGPALLVDREGCVLACNTPLALACGQPREVLLGRNPLDFFPPEIASIRQQNMAIALRTRAFHQWEDERAGRTFLNTMLPSLDAEGEVDTVAIYTVETTKQKELELEQRRLLEELRQAQKMEAIGRLAAGVAHDFNNILAVILGHAEAARFQLPETHRLHGPLEEIETAAERAAALTAQLVAFSKKKSASPRVIELGEAVRASAGMLERVVLGGVTLEIERSGDRHWVFVDPTDIDQILLNLVANASSAMRERAGVVAVRCSREVVEGDGPEVPVGDYVVLEVRDEGEGIAPEALPHIFEPFFTTRAERGGTGLGLATVYGVAKRNAGGVRVESTVGAGTTFRVYLPRRETADGEA